jgi:hypothetical protein
MSRLVSFGGGIVAVALLLFAASAEAAPVQYLFQSGTADIYVVDSVTGQSVMVDASGNPMASTTVVLDGVEVTIDPVANILNSMNLTTTGPWVIDLDPAISAGFDQVTVQSAQLTAQNGQLFPVTPNLMDFQISNAMMSALVDANNPLLGGTITGIPISSVNPSATGTIATSGFGVLDELRLNGITIGTLTSPLSGTQVTVKADFVWRGARPIPEPHAALLFGIGAIVVSAATRKRLG